MDFDRLKVDRNNRGAVRRSAPVVRMTPVVSPSRRSRRSKSSNVKVVNQPQLYPSHSLSFMAVAPW